MSDHERECEHELHRLAQELGLPDDGPQENVDGALSRIRELEGRINRADRYLALGSPNGAREALAPPDSEPAEGEGERCPVCEQGKLTRIECCVCDTCDASPVLADQIRRNDERLGVTPPQRRDAGDILREKLSDPEAMQRVTERAAERQDAMLGRRDALEEAAMTALQHLHWAACRKAPCMDEDTAKVLSSQVRRALSHTSDEGTGCVVPEDRESALWLMARIIERHTEKPPGPPDPPFDRQPEWVRKAYYRQAERAIAEQGGQRVVPVYAVPEGEADGATWFTLHDHPPHGADFLTLFRAAAPQPEHGESDE